MSSVLFQSFNNSGLSELRRDLNQLRSQINDARKDINLLTKALEEKSPEAAEEFMRLKANEAFAAQNAAAAAAAAARAAAVGQVQGFNNRR